MKGINPGAVILFATGIPLGVEAINKQITTPDGVTY